MARRGAPLGNQNAAKGREWTQAIRWALAHHESSSIKRGQALDKIAVKLIELALEGDMAAIREIGNRLDGKPVQPVSGHHDVPVTVIFKDATDRPPGYTRDMSA